MTGGWHKILDDDEEDDDDDDESQTKDKDGQVSNQSFKASILNFKP